MPGGVHDLRLDLGAREALCVRSAYPMLASSSDDRTIRCWDVKEGACAQVIEAGNPANMISVTLLLLYLV